MSREKRKILFLKNIDRPFIENDAIILKKHYDVKVLNFSINGKNPAFIMRTLYDLYTNVKWADLTYSWFADYHAFFANIFTKLLKKKSIIVIGGFEVANVPEINYGAMRYFRSSCRVKYLLNNTTKLLAVSEFNLKEIKKYTKHKNISLVYNGTDYDRISQTVPINDIHSMKKDIVITVCGIDKYTVKRKGLETFVKTAEQLPNMHFVIIGKWMDNSIEYLKSIAPNNVEFTGFISDNELIEWYIKSKVYCQLSYYESFGMGLAESMCYECVPIVSNNAALPEVVGNVGFLVPYGDVEATSEAIKNILKINNGKEARERIRNNFSLERREKELVKIINEIAN